MASQRRVAHVGLASAIAVLVSTLTILAQSNRDTALVGQDRAADRPVAVSAAERAQLTATARMPKVAHLKK